MAAPVRFHLQLGGDSVNKDSNLTRRTFVKAPAALAAGAPVLLSAQSPNEKIRVGIIGVGGRGTSLLRRILNSPNVTVAAICDIDEMARLKAAARAADHQPDLIRDFRDLLDRKDIDAVFVATPVDEHKEMAVAALEVHKNLYLEKPMGRTPEEVKAVYQASQSSRGLLQTGFQLRFHPARVASVEHIHSGGIGNVLYMQANRHTGDLPRDTEWYFNAAISGNMIVEQACHIVDLMNWVAKGHPVQAYGAGGIALYEDVPPGRTTWDHYVVIYEYPDDLRLCFTHVYFDPRGFTGIQERVWGSEYAIDLTAAEYYRLEPRSRKRAAAQKLEMDDPQGDANQRAVDAFFNSIRENEEPLNNAEWGRMATLACIMGRTAIEEKRIVKWSEVDV